MSILANPASAVSSIWGSTVEPFFDFFGLLNNRLLRFVVVTGFTAALLYGYQPESLFLDGQMRPWAIWSNDASATPISFWPACLFFGTMSVLFV